MGMITTMGKEMVSIPSIRALLHRSLAEINLVKFEVNMSPKVVAKDRKPARVKAEASYDVKSNTGELRLRSKSGTRLVYPIRLPEEDYNVWVPLMNPVQAIARARAKLVAEPSPTFDQSVAGQAELGQQAFDMRVRLATYELISKLLNHRNVKPANLVWNGEVKFNIIWDGFPGRNHPRS
jgi:hypothetical protein